MRRGTATQTAVTTIHFASATRNVITTSRCTTLLVLQVNSFVGAFHDAVILYALALNDTLAEGEDPRNGTAVTRRMWNRTFIGMYGILNQRHYATLPRCKPHYQLHLVRSSVRLSTSSVPTLT